MNNHYLQCSIYTLPGLAQAVCIHFVSSKKWTPFHKKNGQKWINGHFHAVCILIIISINYYWKKSLMPIILYNNKYIFLIWNVQFSISILSYTVLYYFPLLSEKGSYPILCCFKCLIDKKVSYRPIPYCAVLNKKCPTSLRARGINSPPLNDFYLPVISLLFIYYI